MTHAKRILPLLLAALLTACASSAPPEVRRGKDSREESSGGLFTNKAKPRAREALEVPPDLLATASVKVRESAGATATYSAAEIAAENAARAQDDAAQSDAAAEVLPEVIGASIERDGARMWLSVDAEAEVVWAKLTEFWQEQEVELASSAPRAGLMETDWFAKERGGDGVGEVLAAFISARTAVDKFTLRLERAGESTNVYVTHRRRERIGKEFANRNRPNEYEWVERETDAERTAQLLQAIVLLFARENV